MDKKFLIFSATICIALFILLIFMVSPIQPEINVKNPAVYPENIVIFSMGKAPLTSENMTMENYDEWFLKLRQVTVDSDKDLDTYYYPNGPVIGHGYDMYGTMVVQINKDMKVDPILIKEIYEVIKKDGERNGIKDIPCKFLSIGLMKVESRFDKIRPVVGGIELSSTNGWGTTDFRGRNSANIFMRREA
ncbi:hypothetical protein [Methanoregula sp.]|uniref:hypothetical protein n=1 Tax=Methanoregula sp. TaxID=2052170 RepID=UPI0026100A33|nr:hypothetical protein [Methanoregula sp.]MDD5142375.1 hypothetical protein [Methanoregula sp.]